MNLPQKLVRSLFFLIGLTLLTCTTLAESSSLPPNSRNAQIILFVPDDAEIPAGYQSRLHDIALRTETFFAEGIEQWGWPVARREIFSRNASGKVTVTLVRGELPEDAKGRKGFPLVGPLAMAAATAALGDQVDENTVWWTFYHTPKRVIKGFRGGGDRDGGRATNVYPTAEGNITPDIELGAPEMWPLNLKGCLHEFGHALGLPHIGPNPSAALGNTLMGPINRAYASKLPKNTAESRVYLCEASATLLAKHPLFVSNNLIPSAGEDRVEITNIEFVESENHTIKVKGTYATDTAMNAIVALDSDRRFGDYWSRSYTAKISEEGKFSLLIDEPFPSPKGFLTLYFCLTDGRNKAADKQGGLQFHYEGPPGSRVFTLQSQE